MGMYTQVRGWLNVDSIGGWNGKNFDEICQRLHEAQETFLESPGRSWVCKNTIAMQGGNGSVYIFFGTELKNYESEAETWIKYLLQYFPNAEGRIDFQYEEEMPDGESFSKYWLIYKGTIVKEDACNTWCYGYGNSWREVSSNGI